MIRNIEKDKGIQHHATLNNLNDTIKKVQEIEFNTTKIEEQIAIIEQELEKKISDNYINFGNSNSTIFLTDTVKGAYDEAITRLNNFNQYLEQEYNTYYVIYNSCIELESNLEQINKDNLPNYIKEVQKLVTEINETSQMDYKMEAKIVEKVYYIAYQLLKLESIYLETNELLDKLKQSETNISYIKRHIEKDINKLDLTDANNKEIKNKILEIKKKGINNSNYLDKKLIQLLTLSCDQNQLTNKQESFLQECKEAATKYNEIEKLIETTNNLNAEYKELKKSKRKYIRKLLRKEIFLVGNFATVTISAFGLLQGTKNWSSDKIYKTKIETFDSTKGKVETEEPYLKNTPNSTIITEYTPWIEPGYFREDYTREIYTYDITELELKEQDIMNYLSKGLMKSEDILITQKTETSKEKPNNIYHENIYKIKKITQNKDQFRLEPNLKNFTLGIFVEVISIGLIEVIILWLIKSTNQERKHHKEELESAKRKLLNHTEKLNNLISQYEYSKNSLEREYQELPSVLHENTSIRKRMKSLKEISKDDYEKK